jgi:hypothetical protein
MLQMRSTTQLNDELIERDRLLVGIEDGNVLVRMGLEALIARESARRLAGLAVVSHD